MKLYEARDKVLYGKERRSLEMDENEKRTTAYHESGHAIVGLVVKHADPVDKVTIIPRGHVPWLYHVFAEEKPSELLEKRDCTTSWPYCWAGGPLKKSLSKISPAERSKISNGRPIWPEAWSANGA